MNSRCRAAIVFLTIMKKNMRNKYYFFFEKKFKVIIDFKKYLNYLTFKCYISEENMYTKGRLVSYSVIKLKNKKNILVLYFNCIRIRNFFLCVYFLLFILQ